MSFTVENKEKYSIVYTKVDKLNASNANELKSELLLLNKNSVNNVIIDLSDTKYCDSSGLSAILNGNRWCKDTNGTFVLAGLTPAVEKMIKIAQLDRVLNIVPTKEEAEDFIFMEEVERELTKE